MTGMPSLASNAPRISKPYQSGCAKLVAPRADNTPSALAGPGVSRPTATTADLGVPVRRRTPSSDSTRAAMATSGPSRTRLRVSTRLSTRKLPAESRTVALLLVPPLSRPTTTSSRIDCPPPVPCLGRSADTTMTPGAASQQRPGQPGDGATPHVVPGTGSAAPSARQRRPGQSKCGDHQRSPGPAAPSCPLAALSSSPIQQRYRLLLRLARRHLDHDRPPPTLVVNALARGPQARRYITGIEPVRLASRLACTYLRKLVLVTWCSRNRGRPSSQRAWLTNA